MTVKDALNLPQKGDAMNLDAFDTGVCDARSGVYRLPDVSFFGLQTEWDRWYWHGWHWAVGRAKFLAETNNA